MQAFCCEVVRAFTKLGMAIAASNPMMATTIMISTSVKPLFFAEVLFILFFNYKRRERIKEQVYNNTDVHGLLFENRFRNESIDCASKLSLACPVGGPRKLAKHVKTKAVRPTLRIKKQIRSY